MLARPSPEGTIFIGQPAHAWLSGQLARAWGNEKFGYFQPHEEVCLAAAQHDIGMTDFDLSPTLDPTTGFPHLFTNMPRTIHVDLWNRAARNLIPQSRYAALLVSLHGAGLYRFIDVRDATEEVKGAVDAYLTEQERFQEGLLAALRADPSYAEHATDSVVTRNRRLIQIWDLLSLRICMGFDSEVVHDVPAAEENLALMMVAHEDELRVSFDPWPFLDTRVSLTVEGRILSSPSSSEDELHDRLASAPWKTLRIQLGRLQR